MEMPPMDEAVADRNVLLIQRQIVSVGLSP